MDLKFYYQKIRETQAAIADEFPIIVSRKNNDGGKAGTFTEVTRAVAARMIVEGTAELATTEQALAFYEHQAEAARQAQAAIQANNVRLTVIPDSVLQQLTKG